jgi:FK506-binding nuclear protein
LLMDGNVFCSSGGKSVVEVPKNSSVIYEIELVKVK